MYVCVFEPGLPTNLRENQIVCGLSAYGLPFNSPLRLSANHIVTAMLEAGLYDIYKRWTMDFVRAMFVQQFRAQRPDEPVAWSDLAGVFAALFGGLGLAALLLVGELLHFQVQLRRTRRRKLARRALAFVGPRRDRAIGVADGMTRPAKWERLPYLQ